MLKLNDDIAVPTATSRRNNVLVEREWDEDNDAEEVDRSAHGAHALGDLGAVHLAHVAALEASTHEGRA